MCFNKILELSVPNPTQNDLIIVVMCKLVAAVVYCLILCFINIIFIIQTYFVIKIKERGKQNYENF